eukprot:410728_1
MIVFCSKLQLLISFCAILCILGHSASQSSTISTSNTSTISTNTPFLIINPSTLPRNMAQNTRKSASYLEPLLFDVANSRDTSSTSLPFLIYPANRVSHLVVQSEASNAPSLGAILMPNLIWLDPFKYLAQEHVPKHPSVDKATKTAHRSRNNSKSKRHRFTWNADASDSRFVANSVYRWTDKEAFDQIECTNTRSVYNVIVDCDDDPCTQQPNPCPSILKATGDVSYIAGSTKTPSNTPVAAQSSLSRALALIVSLSLVMYPSNRVHYLSMLSIANLVVLSTRATPSPTVCLTTVREVFDVSSYTEWSKYSSPETFEGGTFILGTDNGYCYDTNPCIKIIGINPSNGGASLSDIYIERTLDTSSWSDVTLHLEATTRQLENSEMGFIDTVCDSNTAVRTGFNAGVDVDTHYSGCIYVNVASCGALTIRIGGYLSGTADHVYVTYVGIDYTVTSAPTASPTPSPTASPTPSPTICLTTVREEFNVSSFTGWMNHSSEETPIDNTFAIVNASDYCYGINPCITIVGIPNANSEDIYIERTLDTSSWSDVTLHLEATTRALDNSNENGFIETVCDHNTAVRTDFNAAVNPARRYSGCIYVRVVSCNELIIRIGGHLSGTADYVYVTYVGIDYTVTLAPSSAPTNQPSGAPSIAPTNAPSAAPTLNPTTTPSNAPSTNPTITPTLAPSAAPTTCLEFDENHIFSDDGQNEESLSHKLLNLHFVKPVTNASKLVLASSLYKQTVTYSNNEVQQLMCEQINSCLKANIHFRDNSVCNIQCSGAYSCVDAIILMSNCDTAHIICNGSNACNELYVEVESHDFMIECGETTSCNFVRVNITGHNKKGTISCIDFGACDSANIFVNPANYKNVQLQMVSYSQNVTFSNGFGYREMNESAATYVQCNTNQTYIEYNNSDLSDNDVERLILNEYTKEVFPCDGVTIICFDNVTSEASQCDLKFTAHSLTMDANSSDPCYWVQVDNVLDISCTGTCNASPTLDPTASPTATPTETTLNPTNNPTIEPTSNPTNNPTFIPTNDPTVDPTIDPTFDPTSDPTTNPTLDPSQSPTLSPSAAPSISPSRAPSFAPSVAPTFSPSYSPTKAPSFSPSSAPSIAPSVAPTFAPSRMPTAAPSLSPSNAPTRLPTVDVDDVDKGGYDYYLDIEYAVHNLTAENKKDIVSNTQQVISEIEEILEMNYFDEEVLKYNAFWLDVKEINDVNIKESRKLTQYDLDILEIQNIPTVFTTRIETKEQLTGFIITKSSGDTFRYNTELNLQKYFNNTALYFNVLFPESELMANAKFTTEAPSDNTALILAIIVASIGLIISFGAFAFNKMPDTSVDNAEFWAPLLISLNFYDFLSDINLSYTIIQKVTFSPQSLYELIFWLAFGSIFFIVLPFASNLFYAMRIRRQKVIQSNPAARSYFTKMLPQFILMCVFCAGTYPVITLTSSRIFGLQIFNAGLLSYELHQLSKIKIRSTIYLENSPQLLIQVLYALLQKELETATILAFVASFLSVVASIIIYQAQKDVSDEYFVSKYFISLRTEEFDADDKANIRQYRGLKAQLGNSLSALFAVSDKSIEIGYIMINDNGCAIHVQMSVFKEDLETLRNNIFRNQLQHMAGYNIQITEDLYIEHLFDEYRDKIALALIDHFHLDAVEKQFSVRYNKQLEHVQDSQSKARSALDVMTKRIATQHRLQMSEVISSDEEAEEDRNNMKLGVELEMAQITDTMDQKQPDDDEKEEAFLRPIYSEIDSLSKSKKLKLIMRLMVDAFESQTNDNDTPNTTDTCSKQKGENTTNNNNE